MNKYFILLHYFYNLKYYFNFQFTNTLNHTLTFLREFSCILEMIKKVKRLFDTTVHCLTMGQRGLKLVGFDELKTLY